MNSRIRVWDPAVRIFHWSLAGIVFSNQWFNEAGETWHSRLGYVACGLVGFRLFWGFIGPHYARFARIREVWPSRGHFLEETRVYLSGKSPRTIAHPPLAVLGMGFMLVCVLLLGLSGWMMGLDRFFGEEWLEETHEVIANLLLVGVGAHVLGVLRESWLHRENLIASMIHGKKRL